MGVADMEQVITIRQADHAEDRLAIFAPFQFKDAIKALPGARAHFEEGVVKRFAYWHVPATAAIVSHLRAIFKGLRVKGDAFFKALVAQADQSTAAQELKTAEEIKDVPGAARPAWKHQARAYWFVHHNPATMLAMQMGSGKSAVVVWTVANMKPNARVLILCPKSVVRVWPKQFQLHTERPVVVTPLDKGSVLQKRDQAIRAMQEAFRANQPFVGVINYESAWRDPFSEWALKGEWDLVVLDESHKIKAPGGKASMFCTALGKHAHKRMCLTGTPMPHSPLDVYSQYRFLDPGVFGTSFARFRAEFAIMGGYGGYQILGWRNLEELTRRMYTIAYRVETRDVLDLPPATHITRYATLGPQARKIYNKLEADFIAWLESGRAQADQDEDTEPSTDKKAVVANHVLTRLLRLAQVANGFAKDEDGHEHQVDTGKEEVLEEELDNLPSTEPVIIFCRFQHDLDLVHRVTKKLDRCSLELSGRRNQLQEWQDGKAPILAVQIQAGGAGIDLTRAAYVFYFSTGYSYGDYDQSLARAVRPGQVRPVTIIHVIAEGTIDEKIMQVLEGRAALVAGAMAEQKPNMAADIAGLITEKKAA
jgi:SNF2 family DNA or RNA helicase